MPSSNLILFAVGKEPSISSIADLQIDSAALFYGIKSYTRKTPE
jgi:hypothetical protein